MAVGICLRGHRDAPPGRAVAAILAIFFVSASLSMLQPHSESRGAVQPAPLTDEKAVHALDSVGSYFIENRGQVADDVRYYSKGNPSVGFRVDGVMFVIRESSGGENKEMWRERMDDSTAVGEATTAKSFSYMLRFEGSNKVTPVGVNRPSVNSNFLMGNDTNKWIINVPSYGEVVYENLYDDIDLVYGFEGGLKYRFNVRPGADSAQIEMAYEGVGSLIIDRGGDLVISTPIGDVRDLTPLSYQGEDEIACPFALRGPASFGFACRGRDASRELVIDPIVYSSFLGGASLDIPWNVAADASGYAYVAGMTISSNFPVTPGAFDTVPDSEDGIVAKIAPDGKSLAWATYFGGSGGEWASGVTIDALGGIYVVGHTQSTDFPATASAFDKSFNGMQDAYVAKFTGNGMLAWATYLGGSKGEQCHAVALDSLGDVVVASYTYSPDFPVTPGAFDVTYDGLEDGYIAKFDPTGRFLLWATYLVGSGTDVSWSIALDSDDNVYATGYTNSTDFPVTPGALDTTFNGGFGDALVAKLNPTGSTLLWATYLGGLKDDGAGSIVFDGSGNLFVAGSTNSADFPVTSGAFSETLVGSGDVFVAQMDAANSDLVWATFLGGSGLESGGDVALDASGAVYVEGETSSADFPTTPDAIDTTLGGTDDAFLAGLSPLGDALLFGTYVGGNDFDDGRGIVIDASGNQYLIGLTHSVDFPVTPDAFQTSFGGGGDVFVMKLGPSAPANRPPVLAWTGDPNYISDGLNPETGTTATNFSYRVAYSDADNQAPAQIEVNIEKPLGTPWQTLQMLFDEWIGPPYNFTVGAIYVINTTLPAGTDFWYSFNATDGFAWATGQPTVPIDAPEVVVDNPPTAVARASPTVAHMGDAINFDATDSTDDFGIISYHWDFGDGAIDLNTVATHAYGSRGTFTATLTVRDTADQNDTDTVSVSIENRLPVSNAGPDRSVLKKTQVSLNGSGSYDPDGDLLTFSWARISGTAVILTGASTPTPEFTPTKVGTYTFRLIVDDGYGGTSEDTVTVSVWGLPPIADLVARPPSAQVDAEIDFDGSGSTDPDGIIVDFAFQFGDDSTASGSAPMRNHSYASPGLYAVTLTVTDDDGNVSTTLLVVEVTSPPPAVAVNFKPIVAVIFAIILAVVGFWSSKRKPWKGGKNRMAVAKAFMATSMPFILAESMTGIISFMTGELAIPPFFGVGSAVDLIILFVGLAISIGRVFRKHNRSTTSDAGLDIESQK